MIESSASEAFGGGVNHFFDMTSPIGIVPFTTMLYLHKRTFWILTPILQNTLSYRRCTPPRTAAILYIHHGLLLLFLFTLLSLFIFGNLHFFSYYSRSDWLSEGLSCRSTCCCLYWLPWALVIDLHFLRRHDRQLDLVEHSLSSLLLFLTKWLAVVLMDEVPMKTQLLAMMILTTIELQLKQ